MADDWDVDDDWEPEVGGAAAAATPTPAANPPNKWADEEDDDSSSEDEVPVPAVAQPGAKKDAREAAKAKRLALAAKEREEKARRAELAQRVGVGLDDVDEEGLVDPIVDKMRLQKKVEQADLLVAAELFDGVGASAKKAPVAAADSIDAIVPKTPEDIKNLEKRIAKKVREVETKKEYLGFLSAIMREACVNLKSEEVKDLVKEMNVVANEKIRAEKAADGKKKKSKAKSHVNVGAADPFGAAVEHDRGNFDDFDDFM